MFDFSPISMTADTILASKSREYCLEILGIINEKHNLGNVLFLSEFMQIYMRSPEFIVGNSRTYRIHWFWDWP